jgi:hypothetical protein
MKWTRWVFKLHHQKCYAYLIKPLTSLTNISLSTGKFPENLKISKIKPHLKRNSK